jgi:hypothetical protein
MMPPERYAYQEWVEVVVFIAVISFLIVSFLTITAPLPPQPPPVNKTNLTTPIPTPTVSVIPTVPQALSTYTEDQYYPGLRLMGQMYTWKRLDVSGLKDMEINTVVYGGKLLPAYHWRSEQWQEYFLEFPQKGNQFLVVFLAQWMNGTTQNDDPSMWGFGPEHFGISVGDRVYPPDPGYSPNLRIRELEQISDLGDVEYLKPYGYSVEYSGDVNATANAGWIARPRSWLRMGFSNRWDGYIVFQVPAAVELSDAIVVANFGEFGDAAWSYRNLST